MTSGTIFSPRPITLNEFHEAAAGIQAVIIQTPVIFSPTLSRMFDAQIFLKLENLQKTGSFKIRGAAHKILPRTKEIGSKGVVAASAGNHAQGVALAASIAGIPSTIVMPEWASISKQEATRNYGGTVILSGSSIGESLNEALEISRSGPKFVHPFDDRDIIVGQGTIGLEICKSLPDVNMVLCPVGGGGLIAGVGTALHHMCPEARVIGVQASVCPSAHAAFQADAPVLVAAAPSIADGINVREVGTLSFDLMKKEVEQIVLVEETMISAAMLMLLERKKILAEGAGAIPLAALMSRAVDILPKSTVVLIISGGNVDSPLLGRIIQQGLIRNGRVMRIRILLDDAPGSLARLLSLVASLKANVLNIFHDRFQGDRPIYMTVVSLELETRGPSHIQEIESAIESAGYAVENPPSTHPPF
ncbi:MAG: threonine ammonia-lyase, partial [Desulfatirhabdiaceae bacterium]